MSIPNREMDSFISSKPAGMYLVPLCSGQFLHIETHSVHRELIPSRAASKLKNGLGPGHIEWQIRVMCSVKRLQSQGCIVNQ